MLKFLPILSILLVSAGLSLALSAAFTKRPHPPMLAVEPAEFKLGLVKPGLTSCEYRVTNYYPDKVDLVAVMRSCGCTTATLDRFQLSPGESAKLHCDFDLSGHYGNFVTNLAVAYRKAGTKGFSDTTTCVASAKIDPVVRLSSEHLEFDGVARTQSIEFGEREPGIHVTGAYADDAAFEVSTDTISHQIEVTFSPQKWRHVHNNASLRIKTNSETQPQLLIPLIVRSK